MIILDSNILIYSGEKKYHYLKKLFERDDVCVSAISRLEVLGYHLINEAQTEYFQSIFRLVKIHSIDDNVVESAINFRKKYNLSVGDSIIAATAYLNNGTLYTHNSSDFQRVAEVKIYSPLI